MGIGVMNKALGNMKKRKDTTPTLDAQVVDLPEGDKNEKQIVIQRPDNDDDKNVNLPAATGGNGLVPPNQPEVNVAALGGNGQLAPLGNRDVAEDVEFTVNKEEPEGIEGYKQAGESWHTGKDEEPEKIEGDEKLAIEDKAEPEEQGKTEQDETLENEDKTEKPEYEYVGTWRDPKSSDDDEEDKDTTEPEGEKTDLSDLLKSGATNFSINDIVEGEPDVPHYQYRSLLRR